VRTKYYRDQTLNLKNKLQFAENEIQHLLKQLEKLEREHAIIIDENRELKTTIDKRKLEKLQQENYLLLKKIEEIAFENESQLEKANQKVKEYELLLSDIQTEINEKEKELDYYKSKVKSLEKQSRLFASTNRSHSQQPLSTAETMLCFFDYSVVKKTEREFIFIGDFHIHNFGSEPIVNPKICFRFSPPELAALKGQIFTFDQASLHHQRNTLWMFLASDWAQEAKEKGEIWIVAAEPTSLKQGESTSVRRFQIPAAFHHSETLIIEGFVYSDSNQKMKSSNNIIFTFNE